MKMKKLLWLVAGAVLALSVIGCPNDTSPDTGTEDDHGSSPPNLTSLAIKNQSFSDLLNVQWQGVDFAVNPNENYIPIGNTVTETVSAGSGYIYFRRKSNPAFARTRDVVVLEENERLEFVFTDNTLIVDANNPDNTGTLKDMQTTVVFFDDAEWESQNYAEKKGFTYYTTFLGDDVFSYHPPYGGTGKSIALGGQPDAKLRLSLTLTQQAKLSFQYANKDNLESGKAVFSIDGVQKATWPDDYDWSSAEYTLEAGPHDIVWTKDDGLFLYRTDEGLTVYKSYLSLDNILVYYIE
jgi:hypothetical protein